MRSLARMLALALMVGIFSMPGAFATTQDKDDDQPHMQAALDALKQAEMHLKEAKHDKAGHRAAALKATEEAIKHTEMGMKAGAANAEKHEHEHDKK